MKDKLYIVMHCGGMPFDGNTIAERSLGGSETAAYYVAKELAARGHDVKLFTNTEQSGKWDGVHYVPAGPATERAPLGESFTFYAMNTPIDVLIVQRHPMAFATKFNAKINLWWLHDLALMRYKDAVGSQMWNLDGVLTVSKWHADQVQGVYGLPDRIMMPIQNGVDLSLYEGEIKTAIPSSFADKFNMLYTSRPERGLHHLVREGGIMERLIKEAPDANLFVCGYDNTTAEMRQFYEALWKRCDELPNVKRLGPLTKAELADLQRQVDLHVYPSEFEETSCITAMECMAAGLPMLASKVGALPETVGTRSGATLIPLKDGQADEDAFVDQIKGITQQDLSKFRSAQRRNAKRYEWSKAVDKLEGHIEALFAERTSHNAAVARHLMRHSDIAALKQYWFVTAGLKDTSITLKTRDEYNECYKFYLNDTFEEHYRDYYDREYDDKQVDYGPEDTAGELRFESVAAYLRDLPAGSSVLDWGCAHGHYTINLAKRHPELRFVGVDMVARNIETAKRWAADDGIENVEFYTVDEWQHGGDSETDHGPDNFALIIAAEVVEHVAHPGAFVDSFHDMLCRGGRMVITVPYGPWEYNGAIEEWPWRAHLHHFERADLVDLFGEFADYRCKLATSGLSRDQEPLGSYVVSYTKPEERNLATQGQTAMRCGPIDYARKLRLAVPSRQTVTLCTIAKNAERQIGRMLRSAAPVIDEVVIGIDPDTTDLTREVIEREVGRMHNVALTLVDLSAPPTEIGFDAARNELNGYVNGDWLLWLDSDEELHNTENLYKYLRGNMFDAYAINRRHLSASPVGVLKVDHPCKLFRTDRGIRFWGVVHEHPETEINKGPGHVMMLPDVTIMHHGYSDETVRRGRFGRNLDLLVRDREQYPERLLGKFLWIRDLAQMCRAEVEANGGHITDAMRERAEAGIELWEELLAAPNTAKFLVDGIEFYDTLARVLGADTQIAFNSAASKLNGGASLADKTPVVAHFLKREHAKALQEKIMNQQTEHYYEQRYY